MRQDFLIISLIVVIIGACIVPGCINPAGASVTSVTTDKDLYHSHDVMKITISLTTEGNMGNATLRLRGIQDDEGHFQLNQNIPVTLPGGPITQVYEHQLPHCSSCSGLLEGTYTIDASLLQNGNLISNMTHTFQLQQ